MTVSEEIRSLHRKSAQKEGKHCFSMQIHALKISWPRFVHVKKDSIPLLRGCNWKQCVKLYRGLRKEKAFGLPRKEKSPFWLAVTCSIVPSRWTDKLSFPSGDNASGPDSLERLAVHHFSKSKKAWQRGCVAEKMTLKEVVHGRGTIISWHVEPQLVPRGINPHKAIIGGYLKIARL